MQLFGKLVARVQLFGKLVARVQLFGKLVRRAQRLGRLGLGLHLLRGKERIGRRFDGGRNRGGSRVRVWCRSGGLLVGRQLVGVELDVRDLDQRERLGA